MPPAAYLILATLTRLLSSDAPDSRRALRRTIVRLVIHFSGLTVEQKLKVAHPLRFLLRAAKPELLARECLATIADAKRIAIN